MNNTREPNPRRGLGTFLAWILLPLGLVIGYAVVDIIYGVPGWVTWSTLTLGGVVILLGLIQVARALSRPRPRRLPGTTVRVTDLTPSQKGLAASHRSQRGNTPVMQRHVEPQEGDN